MTDCRDEQAIWALVPVFAAFSFYYGNWSACIPWVEANRGMDDDTFGAYLSVAVIGVWIAMPILPYLQDLFGSAILNTAGFFLFGASITILCIDGSIGLFVTGFVLHGFATILLYAALIAQGALVEKCTGQPWMGTFSAISGVGGLLGGLIGGYFLEYSPYPVWAEALTCCLLITTVCCISYPFLYHQQEEDLIVVQHDLLKSERTNVFLEMCCHCGDEYDESVREDELLLI
jgi:MFS family permease